MPSTEVPSRPARQDGALTTIKINAITVPSGSGDERQQWLVITRWRDEESFQAWVSSPGFPEGHRSPAERAGGEPPSWSPPPQRGLEL